MQFAVSLNDKAIQEAIARGINLDLKPALTESAVYAQRQIQTRIVKEITPDGDPFAPLTEATWARKNSDAILRETGVLFNAFAFSVTEDQAEITNNIEYAQHLHFGTRYMPARPFMGLSDADRNRIERIVDRDIGRQLSVS